MNSEISSKKSYKNLLITLYTVIFNDLCSKYYVLNLHVKITKAYHSVSGQ